MNTSALLFCLLTDKNSKQAQKLLDEMLEKSLVIVKDANNVPDDDSVVNEGGVRLFKNSTPGIVFDCGGGYILYKLPFLVATGRMF